MGRTIINTIYCSKCSREFDVATEDIEWERINDAGETEEDRSIHDYNVFQTVECPYCGKKNSIVMHAKGESDEQLNTLEVISLDV